MTHWPATEHDEQAALIRWAHLLECRIPELAILYAIPNGGLRHPRTAARLRAEGARAGVWDLHLPVPRNGAPGLWIEMKRPGGRLTREQIAWGAAVRAQGARTVVCHSWIEAAHAILDYLDYPAEAGGLEDRTLSSPKTP